MGKAEWSVTVSDELNDAVMAYLAKSGQGVDPTWLKTPLVSSLKIRALWIKKVTLLKAKSVT